MKAMTLRQLASLADNPAPLVLTDLPEPKPGAGEVLLRVSACAVCHTKFYCNECSRFVFSTCEPSS
jgi:propanol-preferring alcohol dehydrogenase